MTGNHWLVIIIFSIICFFAYRSYSAHLMVQLQIEQARAKAQTDVSFNKMLETMAHKIRKDESCEQATLF